MIIPPNQAFTITYNGRSNQLGSKVVIFYQGKNKEFNALWDTGATNTVVSHEVVADLGMISTGKRPVKTPSGSSVYNTYLVDIGLPNHVMIKDVVVCDSEIRDQGIGALIGMDIITKGDFAVSNRDGKTVFTFRIPSIKLTDYVQQNNASNAIGMRHGKGKRKK